MLNDKELKPVGLASFLTALGSPEGLSPPYPCALQVALGCADDKFNIVVPRRVELLFRE